MIEFTSWVWVRYGLYGIRGPTPAHLALYNKQLFRISEVAIEPNPPTMATPDSDGEIEDDPRVDLSSSQLDRAGRSALAASGRQDRNLTREAGKDAPVGEGRRLGRPLQECLIL